MSDPVPPAADQSAEAAHERLDRMNFDVSDLRDGLRRTRISLGRDLRRVHGALWQHSKRLGAVETTANNASNWINTVGIPFVNAPRPQPAPQPAAQAAAAQTRTPFQAAAAQPQPGTQPPRSALNDGGAPQHQQGAAARPGAGASQPGEVPMTLTRAALIVGGILAVIFLGPIAWRAGNDIAGRAQNVQTQLPPTPTVAAVTLTSSGVKKITTEHPLQDVAANEQFRCDAAGRPANPGTGWCHKRTK